MAVYIEYIEYLDEHHVSMAALELGERRKSGEQIALGNGFPTRSCLAGSFEQVFGSSPRAWATQAFGPCDGQ